MPASIPVAVEVRTVHQPHVRGTAREGDLDDVATPTITQVVLDELHLDDLASLVCLTDLPITCG